MTKLKKLIKENIKRCGTCGKTKPIIDFYKSNRSDDGLRFNCKKCANKQNRDSYLKTKPGKERIAKKKCLFCGGKVKNDKFDYCSNRCSTKDQMSEPSNHPNWQGGTKVDEEGYVHVKIPSHPFAPKDGYIRRARLVLEKKLGRYLTPEEIAHHINEVKDDDRPENISLFANAGYHVLHHVIKSRGRDSKGRFLTTNPLKNSKRNGSLLLGE